MAAVEAVLQINLRLSNHLVRPDQIPVENCDGQIRILRECRFDFIALPEDGVELLRYVVFHVSNPFIPQSQNDVWICFPVHVHRMQICGFDYVNSN